MTTTVASIGNAGFRVEHDDSVLLIDAYYSPIPRVSVPPVRRGSVSPATIMLVTHGHWDHFHAGETAAAASESGATVVGPRAVIRELGDSLPADRLVVLEPAALKHRRDVPARAVAAVRGATITAFRTHHARNHNSYLVELPGLRLFHDGDNEETRALPVETLGRLDALMIGPWQGSGWVEFIDRLKPRHWFMMHLTDEELAEHFAGRFLPDLCDHVPDGLTALRPGESFSL